MVQMTALWSYDIPRQALKAFLLGLAVASICGLIITFMWRVPPRLVEETIITGQAEGRVQGFVDGRADALRDGRLAARADVPALIEQGSYEDGHDMAFDLAWNEAVSFAIERAAHTPTLQLRRLTHWEGLLR